MSDDARQLGTVVRLLPNKGFGFVRGPDGIQRFFHASEVVPTGSFDLLREGQGVTFTPAKNEDRGRGNQLRALQVEVTGA